MIEELLTRLSSWSSLNFARLNIVESTRGRHNDELVERTSLNQRPSTFGSSGFTATWKAESVQVNLMDVSMQVYMRGRKKDGSHLRNSSLMTCCPVQLDTTLGEWQASQEDTVPHCFIQGAERGVCKYAWNICIEMTARDGILWMNKDTGSLLTQVWSLG